METFFLSQNLWDVVEDGYAEPPESASSSDWTPAHQQQYKENIQRNATTLRYIQQGVSKSIFPRIFGVKKAKNAWEILKQEFQGSEKAVTIKLQTLWKEFDNLSMKDSDGVQDFCSRVTEIVNQIKGCGDSIEDKKVNEKVLRCLPPKFDHVAAAIEESRDLSKMTFSDLSGSLRSHEQRINRPSNCRYKCTRCRIPNHSQRDCWYQNKKGKDEANFTKEGDGDYLFYSSKGAERELYNLWYLDSGCSNHMTGERDIFISLDQSFNSLVKLGDGKMQKAVGKGTIAVHTKGGNKKLISDVLYVPNLTQYLLSVGQLIQKGFSIYFDDEKCKIIDKTNNHTVAVVEMSKNKVFPLVMPLDENVALKTENLDLSNLWHLRYGHLNYKGLNLLKQKNMVTGLPDVGRYEKVCEGCIYGKMHRLPFPKNSWRAKAPLELVHADICGPTRTLSLNNRRYFILFVDDYTRMMWIYFLNEKSEAFSTFLQFKALAERQSGCKMKTLRTDRSGEFIYTPFMNYCRDNGIQRQLTVSRSPQQNGVAERKNRTIVEMARSMLKGKGIPNNLWAEACHTAMYILNREKFDEKGEKYLFIGYSDESKGYWLLNPTTNKLVISRDVVFDEASAWQWEKDQSQASSFFEAPVSPPNSSQQNNLEPNSPNSAAESSSDDESPPRKIKSMREIYESCELALFSCEPHDFEEASRNEDWIKAMNEEMATIVKNKTWEMVNLPNGKETIGLKWIFKIKYNEDGLVQKYKARLVAKGYSQLPGVDFTKTFAPVARMETIRTVLALAAQMELNVFQLDVKSAFLNGEIEEEVYVE
ncbi:hypothetical protein KPL70_007130 [Citrus sinensis]|nr:hypothetical protein KPL70_007130 [Citrus sinensis]